MRKKGGKNKVYSMDVNLKGPYYFAHAVLKQMRKQKSGLILNIGSITGAEAAQDILYKGQNVGKVVLTL